MRNLPARDRQIFAQSLYNVVNGEKPSRSCEFKNDKGHYFPVASGDDSLSGLGFDFYVDIFAARLAEGSWFAAGGAGSLQNLYRAKTSVLQNLCSHIHDRKRPSV
jgi:hypothetical protein